MQLPVRSKHPVETGFQNVPVLSQYGFAPWLALPYWVICYLEFLKEQMNWMLPENDSIPAAPERILTPALIETESTSYEGRGGTSSEATCAGFEPAFLDSDSGCIYRSCFANGQPAPIHLLDGLPAELILAKDPAGHVSAVKPSVIAGFIRSGTFYTREQACAAQH